MFRYAHFFRLLYETYMVLANPALITVTYPQKHNILKQPIKQ